MFDIFLENLKKLLKSRIFPIALIYIVLFGVVINRLFIVQIVNGPALVQESVLKDTEEREIESTRGNIYDREGKLLASNTLTYTVVMEDSTKITSNEQRNAIIYKLLNIIDKNKDTLDNEFYIAKNKEGKLEFTLKDDDAISRFKKKVFSWVLKNNELTEEQKNATAEDVYEFLRTGKGYEKQTTMFEISDSYSVEDTLRIMSIRYALFCNYPKYLKISVASSVSDATVAAVEEDSDELLGVEIEQQTHRVYEDSTYFSNIIGYTGLINATELEKYNKDTQLYNLTDVVGKTGIEYKYEPELRGTKGKETVSVNAADKVIGVIKKTDPAAGNDIYLTIDKDLQISTYHLLEKELAAILLQNMSSTLDYGSKGESATNIRIPIYEVYYALLNNNIVDIEHFEAKDATDLEKQTYTKYQSALSNVFQKLDQLLSIDNTVTNNNAGDMEDYLDYVYMVLKDNNILNIKNIPSDDVTLPDYKNNKISLSKFLKYALEKNWVDLTTLGVGNEYYYTEELYQKLIKKTKDILKNDALFKKKIYRSLVFSYKLSGTEICLLLFDQNVLKYNKDDVEGLKAGTISPYNFIRQKIKKLEITPGMLALAPCSGSVVITDVKTGDIRALVTYPSYDNNKFAGKIDSKYYNKIHSDLALPWMNRPTTQTIAPGSTFKMVTAVAALEEGKTTPAYEIYDKGIFDRITYHPPKCNIYPGSHGSVNLADALCVSCNYYFYEMGWQLSIDNSGKYNSNIGLSKLKKYASLFGLNQKSGIEIGESEPNISTTDSVRSAIGQGSNVFTPTQIARYVTTIANRGTCYDLTLLGKIVSKDGNVIKDNKPKVDHKLNNVSDATWNTVFEGMYEVVNKPKLGSANASFQNFGTEVAGKTGTSQISKSVPSNALFVSFAPYQDPEISVTVAIPNGYTSHKAADLARDIYAYYFNLEDKDSLMKNEVDTSNQSNNGNVD